MKKKAVEASPGAPLWLASFSDMMTNMLCFFILICAFAMQKKGLALEEGLGAIKARLNPALGLSGLLEGSVSPYSMSAGRVVNRAAAPLNQKALVERDGRILDANRDALRNVMIETLTKGGETIVPLPLIFDPGSTELTAGHRTFLDEFARSAGAGKFPIVVEGFAFDEAASVDEGFIIAEGRARAVSDRLIERGVRAERLRVRGRGMLRPGAETLVDAPEIPQNRYGRRMVLLTLLN